MAMPRPKFTPGDWGAQLDHQMLQILRARKAWGPQEAKMRLATYAALAYRHDIELGPTFHAIVRGMFYKNGEAVIDEPVNEEQRKPQSAPEEKPLEAPVTSNILDDLDEEEK
jgi:hypothetical protein